MRKRRRKSERVKLQEKVWVLCREITRKYFPHNCYTCGKKNLIGVHLQTGHMINKKALPYKLKWDIRLLRPQCPACNKTREGMGAVFYRRLLRDEGQTYVDFIFLDYDMELNKHYTEKEKVEFMKQLLERYKAIYESKG